MTITIEKIKAAVEVLKANDVRPRIVQDKKQAALFTKGDPFGRKWKVGEPYFLVVTKEREFGVLEL